MKSILIVFFIVTLLFLLLIFPFKIRFMTHFNFLKLKGFYSVKILNIKLLSGMIYRKNGEIKVENSADMFSGNMSKPFMKKLIGELFNKLDVKKVEIFFTGGFAENSFSSAIMCGSVTSFVQTLYSILSQKYLNVKLYEDIAPTFKKDSLELTLDIVLSLNIFNIITSIIKSNFANNKFKERKNER